MEKTSKNSKHKQAFVIWLAIYPLITLLYALLANYLTELATALKTLILTLIAVPIMFYGMVPLLNKLLFNWLNK